MGRHARGRRHASGSAGAWSNQSARRGQHRGERLRICVERRCVWVEWHCECVKASLSSGEASLRSGIDAVSNGQSVSTRKPSCSTCMHSSPSHSHSRPPKKQSVFTHSQRRSPCTPGRRAKAHSDGAAPLYSSVGPPYLKAARLCLWLRTLCLFVTTLCKSEGRSPRTAGRWAVWRDLQEDGKTGSWGKEMQAPITAAEQSSNLPAFPFISLFIGRAARRPPEYSERESGSRTGP
jgi:hypothetical protein